MGLFLEDEVTEVEREKNPNKKEEKEDKEEKKTMNKRKLAE